MKSESLEEYQKQFSIIDHSSLEKMNVKSPPNDQKGFKLNKKNLSHSSTLLSSNHTINDKNNIILNSSLDSLNRQSSLLSQTSLNDANVDLISKPSCTRQNTSLSMAANVPEQQLSLQSQFSFGNNNLNSKLENDDESPLMPIIPQQIKSVSVFLNLRNQTQIPYNQPDEQKQNKIANEEKGPFQKKLSDDNVVTHPTYYFNNALPVSKNWSNMAQKDFDEDIAKPIKSNLVSKQNSLFGESIEQYQQQRQQLPEQKIITTNNNSLIQNNITQMQQFQSASKQKKLIKKQSLKEENELLKQQQQINQQELYWYRMQAAYYQQCQQQYIQKNAFSSPIILPTNLQPMQQLVQNSIISAQQQNPQSSGSNKGKNSNANEVQNIKSELKIEQINNQDVNNNSNNIPQTNLMLESLGRIENKQTVGNASKKIRRHKYQGLHKEEKEKESLAKRNIKLNFGCGLQEYIEFSMQLARLKQDLIQFQQMKELLNFMIKEQTSYRSFEGWRTLWGNKQFGELLRKLSYQFFSQSYANSYLVGAKIKKEYKKLYKEKIEKFKAGALNPDCFNSYNFS